MCNLPASRGRGSGPCGPSPAMLVNFTHASEGFHASGNTRPGLWIMWALSSKAGGLHTCEQTVPVSRSCRELYQPQFSRYLNPCYRSVLCNASFAAHPLQIHQIQHIPPSHILRTYVRVSMELVSNFQLMKRSFHDAGVLR